MKTKQINNKKIVVLVFAAISILYFSVSYFAIRQLAFLLEIPSFLGIPLVASIFMGLKLHKDLMRRLIFILVAFFASVCISTVLVFATMKLPGSREHNHVMYDICLPAMRKHYGIKEGDPWPQDTSVDKEGFGKSWSQHSECEQNVWNGKGPVFSENPPGFVPIKK